MATPDNKNFLGQTGFRLVLDRIPTVSYFSQSASIPPVSIGTSNQTNPFTDIPLAGEKITYSPFNLTFRVDEDMINYLEIYNWLVGLGSPENFDQYKLTFKHNNLTEERIDELKGLAYLKFYFSLSKILETMKYFIKSKYGKKVIS